MEPPKKIEFAPPNVFMPAEIHFEILRTVAGRQNCHIGDVVNLLNPARSESRVRAGVHVLLSRGCLDGGDSGREILLRLTSRGRILIQPRTDS